MKDNQIKATLTGVRIILYVASFLVLAVGISLYLLSERTDTYFSWTINPPLTAAFLGAGYLASFLLELLSAREKVWARARPAVPGVWAFTFITLNVTLVHFDRFHFGSPVWITRTGTWVWLLVYITVPVAMGILWAFQARRQGVDPQREVLLPVWMRTILGLQGVIMFLFGVGMLFIPESVIPLWPWKLSALTSRAIGAWGVGIGVLALQATWENDLRRLSTFLLSYFVYGLLQTVNLLRYPVTLDWSRSSSILFTIVVLSVLLVGGYGYRESQRF
jgi:hypothetical protein